MSIVNQESNMRSLITFAKERNPIWPFAAMILNNSGDCLIKATDCAHISPLYHAESLAIHQLITQANAKNMTGLTLLSTIEPDPLSQSAIYWSSVVQELSIETIVFGTRLETLMALWPFGIAITAQELVDRSCNYSPQIIGPYCEAECDALFQAAKQRQQEMGQDHPAMDALSHNVDDFYVLN